MCDEERGELLDFLVRLSCRQPGKLDDARAVELGDPLAPGAAHRQQPVVAEVEGDAQALVERESLLAHLGVEALDLHGRADEAQSAARRVERAVAEELLELEEVPLGDRLQLALEQQHLPVGVDLFLPAAAADVAQGLGEVGDVVDEAEAVDHRIDDAGPAEVERPRRARVVRGRPLVGRHHLAVGCRVHPDDGAAQLIEHRELANAPRDQLELLAILAIDRVLHDRVIEEERLEERIEQKRDGDSLIVGTAEERKRGSERSISLQELGRRAAQLLERVAKGLEIAAQISVDERPQLPQIGPDELLGQNQDVVLQQPEELQRALLVAVEDRGRFCSRAASSARASPSTTWRRCGTSSRRPACGRPARRSR